MRVARVVISGTNYGNYVLQRFCGMYKRYFVTELSSIFSFVVQVYPCYQFPDVRRCEQCQSTKT